MEPDLGAVAGRQIEVRVPGDGDGLSDFANVVGDDDGVNRVRGEADGVVEVGAGEPVAGKVAGMDDPGDFLSAGDVFDGDVVGFRLEDQAVHCVALRGRQRADVVGGKREGVALPLGGQRLAVGGELAANAVGVGYQER